jgi:hypothetical protein
LIKSVTTYYLIVILSNPNLRRLSDKQRCHQQRGILLSIILEADHLCRTRISLDPVQTPVVLPILHVLCRIFLDLLQLLGFCYLLAHETSSKYLGCTISRDLNWSEHINNITNKASRSLGFLHRNLHIKSRKIKEQAYKSLVRPQLEFCTSLSVWLLFFLFVGFSILDLLTLC